jgi:hypothetical protein
MSHEMHPPVMIDASAERCSQSVRALASMSRRELDAFLEATARASGAVIVARTMRPKAKAIRRTPRHLLRARVGR